MKPPRLSAGSFWGTRRAASILAMSILTILRDGNVTVGSSNRNNRLLYYDDVYSTIKEIP
jgi:hypothetical protein